MDSPVKVLVLFTIMVVLVWHGNAQLSLNFYAGRCRGDLSRIVRSAMSEAIRRDARIPASILRLFFHDCFVNGCDGSILLDDTTAFTGEQNAFPNRNSVRGFDVIDTIKARVDAACNSSVSCADVLALAARDGVILSGGPTWTLPLGRRDARTASQSDANTNLPPPSASLAALVASFQAQNLSPRDMVALSGAHTIGVASCTTFRTHIYNETNINPIFAANRRRTCPATGGDTNLAPLDIRSSNLFDNSYFVNLLNRQGLLHSDQELFNNGSVDSIVRQYAFNGFAFRNDFAAAMVRMGNIRPLTGTNGEIRRNCGAVNTN